MTPKALINLAKHYNVDQEIVLSMELDMNSHGLTEKQMAYLRKLIQVKILTSKNKNWVRRIFDYFSKKPEYCVIPTCTNRECLWFGDQSQPPLKEMDDMASNASVIDTY